MFPMRSDGLRFDVDHVAASLQQQKGHKSPTDMAERRAIEAALAERGTSHGKADGAKCFVRQDPLTNRGSAQC